MQTIPDSILDTIASHRPHLSTLIANLRTKAVPASQCEKTIADTYLMGVSRLSPAETWKLASCCSGQPYGGSSN